MMATQRDPVYPAWLKRTKSTLIEILNTSIEAPPCSHPLVPDHPNPNKKLPIADDMTAVIFLVRDFKFKFSPKSKGQVELSIYIRNAATTPMELFI